MTSPNTDQLNEIKERLNYLVTAIEQLAHTSEQQQQSVDQLLLSTVPLVLAFTNQARDLGVVMQ